MERITKKELIEMLTKYNNIYCVCYNHFNVKATLYNKLLLQSVATINFDTFLKLGLEKLPAGTVEKRAYLKDFYKLANN